jgi:hypothetical protein
MRYAKEEKEMSSLEKDWSSKSSIERGMGMS